MNVPALTDGVHVTIPSDLEEGRRIQNEIADALEAISFGDKEVFAVRLALEEAIVNAIKHGNRMNPDKKVRIAYRVSPERFEIRIHDEGFGFNPAEVPDPTDIEFMERPCGRGVFLIRHYMSAVEYFDEGRGVYMSKTSNGTH